MRWAHRFLDHADRGVRRLGRAYKQGRGVFHAVSHLFPEENKRQGLRGLSAYNQIRQKAMETDRSLQGAGIVR